MAGVLSSLFGGRAPQLSVEQEAAYAAALRPGVVLEVGGRPKPDSRETSWWGGNFIAEPPRAGLVPLVQIRADELPRARAAMIAAPYLLVWIEADPARRTGPMLGLEVQRRPAADPVTLGPVETICRLDGSLACLPLTPSAPLMLLPQAGDAPTDLPKSKPPRAPEDEQPVTVGGWPGWIGASQWPEGGQFVMEIRSSQKGRLMLVDSGSLYLFEGRDGNWQVRADRF
jgi:hypothetical protein